MSDFVSCESVSDACWYPWMRSDVSATCCYLACSRDQPLKLIDSCTGSVRASYIPRNAQDELDGGCVSCCFSPDGKLIWAGSREAIYRLDTASPGAPSTAIKTTPSRKSREGQCGLISCLKPRWDDTGVLAAGSFNGSIGIYDTRVPEDETCVLLMKGDYGVTQVAFNELNGMELFSGHRQSDQILGWDLRTGQKTFKIGPRETKNQRINFTQANHFIYTGTSSRGDLLQFDLANPLSFSVVGSCDDVICGVSINPRNPDILATCSGQRHINEPHPTPDNSVRVWNLKSLEKIVKTLY